MSTNIPDNQLDWVSGKIEGVIVNKLILHHDQRGYLCETFRLDELPPDIKPIMSYISYTKPGIERGPHEHSEQTDLFAIIGPGDFLLELWDNRRDSRTYRHYMRIYAGQDNPKSVLVPPGVAHGYTNISLQEMGMIINFPNKLYRGEGKRETVDETRYEDKPGSPFRLNAPMK